MNSHDLGIPCMQMRAGTSKGAFFLADDLPSASDLRDDLLLRIMGSPDERQIDGIGGAHPLTSKVAVVSPSPHPDADVDYLFLQVSPGSDFVSTSQTCGNILAGVGPFALERGLLPATGPVTTVRIRMLNPTEAFAAAGVQTPDGHPTYDGGAYDSGVPYPAAGIPLTFPGGNLPVFPSGRLIDTLAGLSVTMVDAGMPVVLVQAEELGIDGHESPATLESDRVLTAKVAELHRAAGEAMGLGDVSEATVPKVSIVSDAIHGGTVATRTFIPRRVHDAIGVLGAVSVAAGIQTRGTVASRDTSGTTRIEHPTGTFEVSIDLAGTGPTTTLRTSTVTRTARKLADGHVWPRPGRHLS